MRFDLSGCGAGLDESASALLELGPLAESLGYDGLWINEEHFGQGSRVCLSPILLATALAMRTRTIRIGFSVLILPLFEPIRLAEEIATLDVLSGGASTSASPAATRAAISRPGGLPTRIARPPSTRTSRG